MLPKRSVNWRRASMRGPSARGEGEEESSLRAGQTLANQDALSCSGRV